MKTVNDCREILEFKFIAKKLLISYGILFLVVWWMVGNIIGAGYLVLACFAFTALPMGAIAQYDFENQWKNHQFDDIVEKMREKS